MVRVGLDALCEGFQTTRVVADVLFAPRAARSFDGVPTGTFPLVPARLGRKAGWLPGLTRELAGGRELAAPELLRERFRHTAPARQRPVVKEIVRDCAGEGWGVAAGQGGFPMPPRFPLPIGRDDFPVEMFMRYGAALAAAVDPWQRDCAEESLVFFCSS